jgi:hypothetical protein
VKFLADSMQKGERRIELYQRVRGVEEGATIWHTRWAVGFGEILQ